MLVRWFENGLSCSGGDLRASNASQSFVFFDSIYFCIDRTARSGGALPVIPHLRFTTPRMPERI
jgi:hypothetical protein